MSTLIASVSPSCARVGSDAGKIVGANASIANRMPTTPSPIRIATLAFAAGDGSRRAVRGSGRAVRGERRSLAGMRGSLPTALLRLLGAAGPDQRAAAAVQSAQRPKMSTTCSACVKPCASAVARAHCSTAVASISTARPHERQIRWWWWPLVVQAR